MIRVWRERAAAEVAAASLVIQQARPALKLLVTTTSSSASFGVAQVRSHGARGPGRATPAIRFFLTREGGLSILHDLLLRQPSDRPRPLTEAPFSRAALARRFRISRTHVRQVFGDAEAAGWVALPQPNRIVFSPEMSEQAERHFALTFFAIASAAQAAMEAMKSTARASRDAARQR
ncbi:MAG TPA: hypothetical protein VGS12_03725 [Caulobacteraceae bacterium]|nr:hypothetical protein [Caulobacteraceae bacterium]